jgi:hypothetical protein
MAFHRLGGVEVRPFRPAYAIMEGGEVQGLRAAREAAPGELANAADACPDELTDHWPCHDCEVWPRPGRHGGPVPRTMTNKALAQIRSLDFAQ